MSTVIPPTVPPSNPPAWMNSRIVVGLILFAVGAFASGVGTLTVGYWTFGERIADLEHQVKALQKNEVDSLALDNHLTDFKNDSTSIKAKLEAFLLTTQQQLDNAQMLRNEINQHQVRLDLYQGKLETLQVASQSHTDNAQMYRNEINQHQNRLDQHQTKIEAQAQLGEKYWQAINGQCEQLSNYRNKIDVLIETVATIREKVAGLAATQKPK